MQHEIAIYNKGWEDRNDLWIGAVRRLYKHLEGRIPDDLLGEIDALLIEGPGKWQPEARLPKLREAS